MGWGVSPLHIILFFAFAENKKAPILRKG